MKKAKNNSSSNALITLMQMVFDAAKYTVKKPFHVLTLLLAAETLILPKQVSATGTASDPCVFNVDQLRNDVALGAMGGAIAGARAGFFGATAGAVLGGALASVNTLNSEADRMQDCKLTEVNSVKPGSP